MTSVSRMEMKISQLVASVSQIQTANSQQLQDNNATEQVLGQLVTATSQLMTAMSRMELKIFQLQSDVAELKAAAGILK